MTRTEDLELLARMESLFAAVANKDLAGIEACYPFAAPRPQWHRGLGGAPRIKALWL